MTIGIKKSLLFSKKRQKSKKAISLSILSKLEFFPYFSCFQFCFSRHYFVVKWNFQDSFIHSLRSWIKLSLSSFIFQLNNGGKTRFQARKWEIHSNFDKIIKESTIPYLRYPLRAHRLSGKYCNGNLCFSTKGTSSMVPKCIWLESVTREKHRFWKRLE